MPERLLITGDIGSGKTAFGNVMTAHGFYHVSASDLLIDAAQRQGVLPTREVLGEIADERVATSGPGVWARLALDAYSEVQHSYPAGLILSGPRRPAEIMAAQDTHQFDALYLDVQYRLRKQRFRQRMHLDNPQASEQELADLLRGFRQRSYREANGLTTGGTEGINLNAVRKIARFVVSNNTDIAVLRKNMV